MAEQNADILKTLAEAVNAMREYLRVTAQRRPEMDFGDSQLLPERIEVPAQDARQSHAAPVEDVVIPLPRQRHYDEGYLLPTADETAAEANPYAFAAHYAAEAGAATTPAFWTKTGLLNSFITIGLDVRYCTNTIGDVAGNSHPGFKEPRLAGAPLVGAGWGNAIATRSGKDTNWIDLAYSATDADGLDLGHGITAITGLKIQAQIDTEGTLSLRVDNQTGVYGVYLDITGVLWQVKVPVITIGTQIEIGTNTCHEDAALPNTWGDGHWNPRPL